MSMKLLRRVLPVLAVGASVTVPTSAQAAFVSAWDYTFTSSFANAEFDGGTGEFTTAPTILEWGDGGALSSVGVQNTPTTGVVTTNGEAETADTYFHDNNALPLGSVSLVSAALTINVDLSPADASGASVSPPLRRTFDINFLETPNAGTNGVCADGGAVGSGINSAGCADIFTLAFDFGQFDFEYDGEQYSAFIFEDPSTEPKLGTLSEAACASVGRSPGCFGFLTAEDARTAAQFVLSVEGTPTSIPEPAAVGLLSLGLLGIGAARRRKR